ncbi:MAG: Glu/Leu/Phe/Val family dehydrogenase [Geminicoccaceae bacterium]
MSNLFIHPAFDDHERVVFLNDQASGLRALIAVHNTAAGPAAGGVRFWHYQSEDEALLDVLRLSKGMSFKAVMAGLPLGGGKAVILADEQRTKTEAMLLAFGRAVDQLNGSYIAAEDVGITTEDVAVMRQATSHVAGLDQGQHASGDPSPMTARGVFLGLKAAVAHRLRRDLHGLRVGVLGLGAVGMKLAAMLHEQGARLIVADIDRARVRQAEDQFDAKPVSAQSLISEPMDVLAPCALGGILTLDVVDRLHAKVVAGAANNQLAFTDVGRALYDRGILYAPDYVINAGGVINVAGEIAASYDREETMAALQRIPETLGKIFVESETSDLPTNIVADTIARRRLLKLHAEKHAA